MKKIFLAAMAVTVLFAGCMKNEQVPEKEKLNIVFSVADKVSYGADTRALKQGWKPGDDILIVFESESYDWLDPSGNQNTVLLSFDGEDWYVSNEDEDLIDNLRTSSSWFYAVHYPGTILLGDQDGEGKTSFLTYKGGEYLEADGEWTLDGNDLILGEINMTRRSDMFQISVMDLASDAGDWTLTIENDGTSQDIEITHMNKYVDLYICDDEVGMKAPQDHQAAGVRIGDDVAFSFILDGPSENVNTFTFVLSNGTETHKLDIDNVNGIFQGGRAYLMPGSYSNYWTHL